MLHQNWFTDTKFELFKECIDSQSFYDTKTNIIYVVTEENEQGNANTIIREITPESSNYQEYISNYKEWKDRENGFRIIKIRAGMTYDFEIIKTNASDALIKAQLMYISTCEENGDEIKEPYGIIEAMGYTVESIGCQDDIDFDELETMNIDTEFDYYDL